MTTRDRWLETSIKITILLALFMTALTKADDGTRDLKYTVETELSQLGQEREKLQNVIQSYEMIKDQIQKVKLPSETSIEADADIKIGEYQRAIVLIENKMRDLKSLKIRAQ